MLVRVLVALVFVSLAAAYSKEICQMYCASVNGGASYDNCSPWIAYATQKNKTCYNMCVHNCAAKYDGECMTDENYRCCFSIVGSKKNEFKTSGCDRLYNNII